MNLCCCYSKTEPIEMETISSQIFYSKQYPNEMTTALGGLSDIELSKFMENKEISAKYQINSGIGSGAHWSAVRAYDKLNNRQVIIKKIIKDKLPVAEQYFQPCYGKSSCKCTRCRPDIKVRPPLELILLCTSHSALPQLIETAEDDESYYLVTALHGVSERSLKHPTTWFGSMQWSAVNWNEYFT